MPDVLGGALDRLQRLRFEIKHQPGAAPGLSVPPELTAMPGFKTIDQSMESDRPMLRSAAVTSGLGLDAATEMATRRYVETLMGSNDEAALRQQLVAFMQGRAFPDGLRQVLLARALRYYKLRGVSQGRAESARRAVRGATPDEVPVKSEFMLKAEDVREVEAPVLVVRVRVVADGRLSDERVPHVLEKAGPRGGRYHARVTDKDTGKHRYFYDPEKFEGSRHAPVFGASVLRDKLRRELLDAIPENGVAKGEVSFDERYRDQLDDVIEELRSTGKIEVAGDVLRKPGQPVTVRPETVRPSVVMDKGRVGPARMATPPGALPIPPKAPQVRAQESAARAKVMDDAGLKTGG